MTNKKWSDAASRDKCAWQGWAKNSRLLLMKPEEFNLQVKANRKVVDYALPRLFKTQRADNSNATRPSNHVSDGKPDSDKCEQKKQRSKKSNHLSR